MTIRPGQNLVRLGIVLLVWAVLGFVWAPIAWLIVPTLLVGAVVAVLDFRALRAGLKQIALVRQLPTVVGRDQPFVNRLVLNNPSGTPWTLEVRDVLPAVAIPAVHLQRVELPEDEQRAEIAGSYRIPTRGLYEFGPVWLRLHGPYRMIDAQRELNCRGVLKVLPEGISSREQLTQDEAEQLRMLDKVVHARQAGTGTEFESLSEFREGDDPRRIDWRTTARYRRPIVRRYQVERHRDLVIVIDCGRLMGADAEKGTKLDCAVDSALLLSRVALQSGDRCSLAAFDNEVVRYVPPMSRPGSLRTLVDYVFDLQSRWRESDFGLMFATLQARQPKRALVVILSDIVDIETSQRYRASLAALAQKHVVLFAALQTPLLKDLVHTPVKSVLDGARMAVALRNLRERERAIHSLRHSGVHILDVLPNQLTVPLINQFIELRQQNLL